MGKMVCDSPGHSCKATLAARRVFVVLLVTFVASGCLVFGSRTSEQPEHIVLLAEGNKEIRKYPPMILARTLMVGDYDETSNDSFRRLAGYIFGKNRKYSTTEDAESMKMAMTAPVFQEPTEEGWRMSFFMPSQYGMDGLPTPLDDSVALEEVPPFTVAALRYTGLTSEKKIAAKTEELRAWLTEKGITSFGKSLSARYDPPWTIPFLRRNEVLIVVELEGGQVGEGLP